MRNRVLGESKGHHVGRKIDAGRKKRRSEKAFWKRSGLRYNLKYE